MSLTIALQNTSDTDQTITLFDSGGAGTASFITTNSSFTAQSEVLASGGVPSTQQVSNLGTTYYNAVFNPSTGYYYGGVGTTLGVIATINGSSFSYIGVISSVANRTFDDIQTLLTNQLRNNGTNPRPNAQVVLSVSTSNGVQYLTANVLDTINSNESIIYNSISIYFNASAIGVGGATPTGYLDQIYTSEAGQPSPFIYPANSPSTTFADSDGWFTIQGNNLTTSQSCIFRIYDTYLQSIPTNAGYAFNFDVQLTEPISTGDFIVLNYPSLTLLFSITGSSTALHQISGVVPNGTGIVIKNQSTITSWNGQLKMRIQGMTGSQSIKGNATISLLSQLNQASAYLSSNPNIVGRVSSNGVGLQEILNSTTGNSYKVTSLYIWSINPNQLTQSVTYGTIDANGNIFEQELDIVIDPFAQNSVTYRTNGMNDFIIDSNAIIQFILKAESAVNMKFEYEKNSSDEIKLIEMGLGMLLSKEYEEKAKLDAELADNFDTFYLKQ